MSSAVQIIQNTFRDNAGRTFTIDITGGHSTTYQEMHEQAVRIAYLLTQKGLERGDRIAVIADNSVVLAQLCFGCLYAGLVLVPINPVQTPDQIAYIIANSRSRLVVVSETYVDKLSNPAAAGRKLFMLEGLEDYLRQQAEDTGPDALPPFTPFQGARETDDLIIIYTSGTTASPKGVVHTLATLIHNGRLFADALRLGPDSHFYNNLPMTYLGGYYNLLLIPFLCGGSVLIGEPFSTRTLFNFWEPIIEHQVNTLWLVPSVMAMLLDIDRRTDGITYCKNGHIQTVLAGTAPLTDQLKTDFENKYHLTILENYGLSETFFIASNLPGSSNRGVGAILPGIELQFMDRQLHQVSGDVSGEIYVKTPYLMRGYHNPDAGSPQVDTSDGWFATGDLGYIDDDQNLIITGRVKDIIIRGGVNISPSAIEEVLADGDGVLTCTVVGVSHKIMGEDIAAVLRLSPDADFAEVKSRLVALCREKLPQICHPAHFVELKEFPYTSSGKVQKAKVKAWLENKLIAAGNKHIVPSRTASSGPSEDLYFKPSRVVENSIQAMSIKYNTYVYEMRRAGIDLTVLSLGEAFFDIPLYSFDDLPFPNLYHYGHSRGLLELRERIAEYFLSAYDVSFDPGQEIIITAGSKIAIYMSLMAILDPGDEVVIHEPAWVSYPEQVKLCYGVPVQVPYHETVYDFEKYLTRKTKMIIINNPQNPTGKVFTLEELSHLYALAEKYNLFILSDEAYSDFVLEEEDFVSIGNLDRDKKHLILVNSISKNFGISGWRLGYVIAKAGLIDEILKCNQHMITCPATILEYYLAEHFTDIIEKTKPQITDLLNRRNRLAAYMDQIELSYLPGTGTFYFFVSISDSRLGSEAFCDQLLQKDHIATVPGLGYGKSCDKFIRVSVGTESWERTVQALDTIHRRIREG